MKSYDAYNHYLITYCSVSSHSFRDWQILILKRWWDKNSAFKIGCSRTPRVRAKNFISLWHSKFRTMEGIIKVNYQTGLSFRTAKRRPIGNQLASHHSSSWTLPFTSVISLYVGGRESEREHSLKASVHYLNPPSIITDMFYQSPQPHQTYGKFFLHMHIHNIP